MDGHSTDHTRLDWPHWTTAWAHIIPTTTPPHITNTQAERSIRSRVTLSTTLPCTRCCGRRPCALTCTPLPLPTSALPSHIPCPSSSPSPPSLSSLSLPSLLLLCRPIAPELQLLVVLLVLLAFVLSCAYFAVLHWQLVMDTAASRAWAGRHTGRMAVAELFTSLSKWSLQPIHTHSQSASLRLESIASSDITLSGLVPPLPNDAAVVPPGYLRPTEMKLLFNSLVVPFAASILSQASLDRHSGVLLAYAYVRFLRWFLSKLHEQQQQQQGAITNAARASAAAFRHMETQFQHLEKQVYDKILGQGDLYEFRALAPWLATRFIPAPAAQRQPLSALLALLAGPPNDSIARQQDALIWLIRSCYARPGLRASMPCTALSGVWRAWLREPLTIQSTKPPTPALLNLHSQLDRLPQSVRVVWSDGRADTYEHAILPRELIDDTLTEFIAAAGHGPQPFVALDEEVIAFIKERGAEAVQGKLNDLLERTATAPAPLRAAYVAWLRRMMIQNEALLSGAFVRKLFFGAGPARLDVLDQPTSDIVPAVLAAFVQQEDRKYQLSKASDAATPAPSASQVDGLTALMDSLLNRLMQEVEAASAEFNAEPGRAVAALTVMERLTPLIKKLRAPYCHAVQSGLCDAFRDRLPLLLRRWDALQGHSSQAGTAAVTVLEEFLSAATEGAAWDLWSVVFSYYRHLATNHLPKSLVQWILPTLETSQSEWVRQVLSTGSSGVDDALACLTLVHDRDSVTTFLLHAVRNFEEFRTVLASSLGRERIQALSDECGLADSTNPTGSLLLLRLLLAILPAAPAQPALRTAVDALFGVDAHGVRRGLSLLLREYPFTDGLSAAALIELLHSVDEKQQGQQQQQLSAPLPLPLPPSHHLSTYLSALLLAVRDGVLPPQRAVDLLGSVSEVLQWSSSRASVEAVLRVQMGQLLHTLTQQSAAVQREGAQLLLQVTNPTAEERGQFVRRYQVKQPSPLTERKDDAAAAAEQGAAARSPFASAPTSASHNSGMLGPALMRKHVDAVKAQLKEASGHVELLRDVSAEASAEAGTPLEGSLTMTATTKLNLDRVMQAVASGQPLLLQGDTGVGSDNTHTHIHARNQPMRGALGSSEVCGTLCADSPLSVLPGTLVLRAACWQSLLR